MSSLPEAPLLAVLPCDLTAAGRARRLLAEECRAAGVRGDAADSAELLVSEVVTNAVIHGRSEVRLSVCASPRCLRVEVGDDNSRRPRVQELDAAALDGRGLAIVDMVATRWGVADDDLGKVVWFELAV
ncbi:ATP-binding protein [Quadrisphaera sp. DSM 44207]|uniref:ATP-binding protein n=1 Tax=Quadrisphaera sp. DSM 44207 TaxID=1881057 RepID=UPI00088D716B|nr:ATP-binding protein [Quadrisphaera sp. DSM 44207]SDQ89311.1 Anti-sigma regulatory factor (Ser/Thr protein kinase) [Quadrisphaera sp. DSM 44207]